MTLLNNFLPYLNIILTIGLLIGGVIAYRHGYSRTTGEIQENVINALKEEVAVLRRKVEDLDKERGIQDRVIATIRYALKQYGLRVTIAGDFVTLNDSAGKSTAVQVLQTPAVKPLVIDPDPEDSDGIS